MNNVKFQKQRGAVGTHPADAGRVGPIQVCHSGRAEDDVNARSQTAEARGLLRVDRRSEGKEGDGGGEATEVAMAAGPGGEASAVAATRPRREGGAWRQRRLRERERERELYLEPIEINCETGNAVSGKSLRLMDRTKWLCS